MDRDHALGSQQPSRGCGDHDASRPNEIVSCSSVGAVSGLMLEFKGWGGEATGRGCDSIDFQVSDCLDSNMAPMEAQKGRRRRFVWLGVLVIVALALGFWAVSRINDESDAYAAQSGKWDGKPRFTATTLAKRTI